MRILLVEDDQKAARLLVRGLREEGFVVEVAGSAEEGHRLMSSTPFELVILDWMLPGDDGLSLCRALRARGIQIPILMLTARDALGDRVEGLNTGADDYLTKPFAFDELLARVRALLRRSELKQRTLIVVGDLSLDPITHRVMRADRALDLTPTEFSILAALMDRPGEVISRAQLAGEVWKADIEAVENLIEVHLSNLRRKIDAPGSHPLLHTVRTRGYRIAAQEDTC